jgi:uncharacterized lipoprotein
MVLRKCNQCPCGYWKNWAKIPKDSKRIVIYRIYNKKQNEDKNVGYSLSS